MLQSRSTTRSIKESIRIYDAIENENQYARKKFREKFEFIDIEARNCFTPALITPLRLKYCYSFNYYVARERIINYGLINEECLWCSRKEDWDHIIQCPKTLKLKVDFVIELKEKLMKARYKMILEKLIDEMIMDIRKYLVNKNEFTINQ